MKSNTTLSRIACITFVIFILFLTLPYLIPITSYKEHKPEPVFDNSELFQSGGITIHYRIWTPDSSETAGKILLIHGLGGSTYSWEKNTKDLKNAGYFIVAADLPGFGFSSREAEFNHSQRNRGQLLWQLLSHVDQSLPVETRRMDWSLGGHSMGGGTAAAMAMEQPERVRTLILIDGALYDNHKGWLTKLLHLPPLARWMEVALRHRVLKPEKLKATLASAYGREPSVDEVEGYVRALTLPGTETTLLSLVKTAKSEHITGLEGCEIPILGIWGEKDNWVKIDEAYRIRDTLQSMEIRIIEGAAHCPMETHSKEFNRMIVQYLSQNPEKK